MLNSQDRILTTRDSGLPRFGGPIARNRAFAAGESHNEAGLP